MARDPYASLKHGLVGAWIPSISGSGLLLPDLSGRGNNGVLTNMGPEDWVASGGGRALDFDGTNDYVSLTDTNSLRITSGSIAGWFKSAPLGASTYKCIAANYAQSATVVSGWSIGINIAATGTDKLGIVIGNNTGQSSSNVNQVYTANTVTDSLLHHFVFNITDAGDVKIYLDGVDAGATRAFGSQVPIVYATTSYVSIAAEQTGPTYGIGKYWPNILDDIRIYSRALTEAEIRLLASDRGIGFKPNKKLSRFSTRYTYQPPKAKVFEGVRVKDHDYASLRQGLVGAWCPSLPNGGSGNLLVDQSGRGNNGTLTNMGPEDWVASEGGRALDIFDDQYVDCTTMNGLSLAYPFSMACWVYNMTSNNIDFSPFAKTRQIGTYQGPMIYFASATNATTVAYWAGGTRATGATVVTQLTSWTHIGICWTGNQARVYVNGRLDGTGNTTTAPNASTASVNLGRYNSEGYGQRSMRGLIDDCRIYDRCLTDSEWAILASKRGIGLQPSPTRFIAKEKKTGLRRRILTGQT